MFTKDKDRGTFPYLKVREVVRYITASICLYISLYKKMHVDYTLLFILFFLTYYYYWTIVAFGV